MSEQQEIGAVRAKMVCQSFETVQWGQQENHKTMKIRLGAVYGGDGEDKHFSDATPSGECWMQINAGRPAAQFFKPGKKYYVTFTEAPD